MDNIYYAKYMKYKTKYLKFKNSQVGGGDDPVVLLNHIIGEIKILKKETIDECSGYNALCDDINTVEKEYARVKKNPVDVQGIINIHNGFNSKIGQVTSNKYNADILLKIGKYNGSIKEAISKLEFLLKLSKLPKVQIY